MISIGLFLIMSDLELQTSDTGKSSNCNDPALNRELFNIPVEEDDSQFYNGRCGIWKCMPKWLQILNNPKMFLFSISIFVLFQGSVATGFISIGLSSIERRYDLSSSLSAFAAVSYEIGVILVLPFGSYLGGRSHKPRVLGVSLFFLGIGCFVFASPQFISGIYTFNSTVSTEMCTNSSFNGSCNFPLIYYYPLFVIGNIIIGCGSSTLYTVGTGFIDDSTHPRYSSIYLSIFYILAVLGPAIGFGLGGIFLSFYVDPFTSTTLTSDSPQWVGGWWIGFVLTGFLSIFASSQFFFYPRRLKGSRKYDNLRKEQQPIEDYGISFQQDHGVPIAAMLKEYPHYLYRILKNLTFLFITIAVTIGAFLIAGIVTFLPKYIEVQFSVSPSVASYLIGGISIPAASIGILLGGITLFIFKNISVQRLALMVFILTLIQLVTPPVFLVSCSSKIIAGVNFYYPNSSVLSNFVIRNINASCFSDCHCESYLYQPICSKGVTYYSPCLAGCPKQGNSSGYFSNCTCLNYQSLAVDGECPEICTQTIIIAGVLLFFAIILLFYNNIPLLKLTLRSVSDKDRTVALGIQSLIARIFGQLPGPLAVGGIFDLNCDLWQETGCGNRGSCIKYNAKTLSYSLIVLLSFGIVLINIFFLLAFFAWKFRKDPPKECGQ